MTVWFTSDTHYGHRNIITYCDRPFKDVEEMDWAMINRWNEVVQEGDTVYHIGDFSFYRDVEKINRIVLGLKGEKHLIYGNHDQKSAVKQSKGWQWKGDYKRIEVEGQKINLFHYAMKVWHGSHKGAWQLFGHSHGSLPRDYKIKQLDVGVDVWNFYPISFEQVKAELSKHGQEVVDSHGAPESEAKERKAKKEVSS